MKETTDWEVASHGYRWIDYENVDEETEKEHIKRTIEIHERLLGKRPVGFYLGKVRIIPYCFSKRDRDADNPPKSIMWCRATHE